MVYKMYFILEKTQKPLVPDKHAQGSTRNVLSINNYRQSQKTG